MPSGTVKWYNPVEGIGMITSDVAGLGICLERCALSGSLEPCEGERVEFDVWEDISGLWANNVHRAKIH
jgi:cold shock CspA family protein